MQTTSRTQNSHTKTSKSNTRRIARLSIAAAAVIFVTTGPLVAHASAESPPQQPGQSFEWNPQGPGPKPQNGPDKLAPPTTNPDPGDGPDDKAPNPVDPGPDPHDAPDTLAPPTTQPDPDPGPHDGPDELKNPEIDDDPNPGDGPDDEAVPEDDGDPGDGDGDDPDGGDDEHDDDDSEDGDETDGDDDDEEVESADAGDSVGASGLALTGGSIAALAMIGTGLVGFGAFLAGVGRRPNQHRRHTA